MAAGVNHPSLRPPHPLTHSPISTPATTHPGSGRFDEQAIEDVLKRTPVALGRGKATVSLMDAIPNIVVDDLKKLSEEFCKENC